MTIVDAAGNVCGLLEFGPYLQRSLFFLAIFPTERAQPHPRPAGAGGGVAPAVPKVTGSQGVVAHAWVQRDDSLYGYPQAGRQSYFDDPGYVRFAEANFGLRGDVVTDDEDPAQLGIADPGDAREPLQRHRHRRERGHCGRVSRAQPPPRRVLGGRPEHPARGRAALRLKPDLLLPSEGSKAHPGILAAGSRSGARVALSGTSVAAPQLARFVADRLAAGQTGNRADVVAQARQPAAAIPPAVAANPGAARPGSPARPRRLGPAAATRSADRGRAGSRATHASR